MAEPIPLAELAEALQIGRSEHIALVGGGGKSTLLHALGRQLSGSLILTTTTKMGHDQHEGHRVLVAPTPEAAVAAAREAPVVVWSRIRGQSAIGVDPSDCDAWVDGVDYIVVEADGARRKPFKAPRAQEPVVPSTTSLMVSVIGADALGYPIDERCHRPLIVAERVGCEPDDTLTPLRAAAVILHPDAALLVKPDVARLAVVVTKVTAENRSLVDELVAVLEKLSPDLLVVSVRSEW
jgi:probable selenium-dependent hydroxylase accessory protein YqeC